MTWKLLQHRLKSGFLAGAPCCLIVQVVVQATRRGRSRRQAYLLGPRDEKLRVEKHPRWPTRPRAEKPARNLSCLHRDRRCARRDEQDRRPGRHRRLAVACGPRRLCHCSTRRASPSQDTHLAGVHHRPRADADRPDDLSMQSCGRVTIRSRILCGFARRLARIRRLPYRTRDLCRHERRRRTRIHARTGRSDGQQQF